MYDDLCKALRELTESCDIVECYANTDAGEYRPCKYASKINQAIATIEKLTAENRAMRNELCLYCGKYKMAHLGACDGCRFKEDK